MGKSRPVFLNAHAPFWLLFACAGSLGVTGTAFAVEGVGDVISVKPGAFVLRGGKQLPLALQSRVHQKDVLITDANGKLQIILDDDTTLALAPSTQLALQSVVPEGKPEFKAHVSSGLARFITGKIVEKNPGGFKISTPEGTVGIRGTIGAVQTLGGVTTAYNINSGKLLDLNGVAIGSGEMAAVGDGISDPQAVPIPQKVMDTLDQRTASGVGAGGGTVASQEEGQGESVLSNADANTAVNKGSDLTILSPAEVGALDLPLFAGTAMVSGTHGANRDGSFQNFSFTADLTNGAISDCLVDFFSIFYMSVLTFDIVGSGTIDPNSFSISGYDRLGRGADVSLSGNVNVANSTLNVTGTAVVNYDSGPWVGPLSGSGTIQP